MYKKNCTAGLASILGTAKGTEYHEVTILKPYFTNIIRNAHFRVLTANLKDKISKKTSRILTVAAVSRRLVAAGTLFKRSRK
jgi:hypothetical protein